MKKVSDFSCVGPKGKPIYGTSAILHRLFNGTDTTIENEDRDAFMKDYIALIKKCGYATFEE